MTKARCPKCGEKIDCLDVRSEEIIYYRFDHNGYEEVDKEDMSSDSTYFDCPECGALVARTETEAREILFQEEMTKARCPKCRKEIEHLNAQAEETIWYRFDNSGYSECEEMGETIYFHCPECEELIVETEEEAKKILGVEKILRRK